MPERNRARAAEPGNGVTAVACAGLLILCPVPAWSASPTGFQLTFDVEGPAFEFLGGDWQLAFSGSYHDHYYFIIDGPGDGNARGRWIAEGLPAGTYDVEFFADSGDYAADARYQVVSAGGVSDLTVDMNFVPAGWNPLGTFDADGTCVVTISDHWEGAGSQISVDALRFTLTSAQEAPESGLVPHIGLCIDDLGAADPADPTTSLARMLALPLTMTYAVLPDRTFSAQSADAVHAQGSEVILHQPMAAISIPDPGPGSIVLGMTPAQVRSTVEANLDGIPHVMGLNNHIGSLATQQRDLMGPVMDVLLERDLLFLDSRTYTNSVAFDVAHESGMFATERDLFIDANDQISAMAEIRELAVRALHAPELPHIGIGHVRSHTAAALEAIVPELEAMGVEVWPVSRCLSQTVEVGSVPEGASIVTAGAWASDEAGALSELLHDGHSLISDDPAATVTFTPALPFTGDCDVFVIWGGDEANAAEVRAEVTHLDGTDEITLDQTESIGRWVHLGRFPCGAGGGNSVRLRATGESGTLRADAVRFNRVGPPTDQSGVQVR